MLTEPVGSNVEPLTTLYISQSHQQSNVSPAFAVNLCSAALSGRSCLGSFLAVPVSS